MKNWPTNYNCYIGNETPFHQINFLKHGLQHPIASTLFWYSQNKPRSSKSFPLKDESNHHPYRLLSSVVPFATYLTIHRFNLSFYHQSILLKWLMMLMAKNTRSIIHHRSQIIHRSSHFILIHPFSITFKWIWNTFKTYDSLQCDAFTKKMLTQEE